MLDGVERQKLQGISYLRFSADGTAISCIGTTADNRQVLETEGASTRPSNTLNGVAISRDLRRVVTSEWAGFYGGECIVGVDGSTIGRFGGKVQQVAFSADSKRVAVVISWDNNGAYAILDGSALRKYDQIASDSFQFSSDAQHFRYLARVGGRWLVVVDGEEIGPFDDVDGRSIQLAANSTSVRFAAAKDGKWSLFSGGERVAQFDRLIPGSVAWTDDGKRGGCVGVRIVEGRAGSKHEILVGLLDGQEFQTEYVAGFTFSAGGQHVAFVSVADGGQSIVTDMEVAGPAFDAILLPPSERVSFSNETRFSYVAKSGSDLLRVEEEIVP